MSEGARVSRRRFLLAAAGLAVPLALGRLRPWEALVEFDAPSLGARLAALLADLRSASAIGRDYLRAAPGEATVPVLVDAIASDVAGGREALRTATDSEVRELLALRVLQDFEEERVVNLEGWIVAPTEARLCALAALAGSRATAGRPGSAPRL